MSAATIHRKPLTPQDILKRLRSPALGFLTDSPASTSILTDLCTQSAQHVEALHQQLLAAAAALEAAAPHLTSQPLVAEGCLATASRCRAAVAPPQDPCP